MDHVDKLYEKFKPQGEGSLQDVVYATIKGFLKENKGKPVFDLYVKIISEIEPVLLQCVMESRRGNQVQAAKMLGISRGNVRKKLQRYFGRQYFRISNE